jgi:hypothetical protein
MMDETQADLESGMFFHDSPMRISCCAVPFLVLHDFRIMVSLQLVKIFHLCFFFGVVLLRMTVVVPGLLCIHVCANRRGRVRECVVERQIYEPTGETGIRYVSDTGY